MKKVFPSLIVLVLIAIGSAASPGFTLISSHESIGVSSDITANSNYAIGVVTQLPLGAKYPVNSEYPTGPLFVRMRVSNTGHNWTSPDLNAQQALDNISQLKPQALERMTEGPFSTTWNVPVCKGCSKMTYGQFLDNATQACGCYIIPRIDMDVYVDNGSQVFFNEAKQIFNAQVTPRFQILSVDNWGSVCTKNERCSCSFAQNFFQPLYAMGWKGIGVLDGSDWHSTCGWATYADFDINSTSWTINTNLLSSIKADSTIQKILLYDPDFPLQDVALQDTCGSLSGGVYYSCDQMADAISYAAQNQAQYGYNFVYPIEEATWDSNQMYTSNGSSIYDVMQNLISEYNAVTAPVISANPAAIDSGQSSTLFTNASFSGGTSPYTCQWLERAPGTSSYTNLSSSFTCTTSSEPTMPTGNFSTTGTWSFEFQVNDSGSPAEVVTSNAVTVTVNSALVVPAISATAATIDSGQSSTLCNTTDIKSGTAPYGYQWFETAPNGSSYLISGANSFAYSFVTTVSTANGTWSFELQVADYATSVNSTAVTVSVNPVLVAPVISANPAAIDSGQSSTLFTNASFSGGTSPYTCQWLDERPGSITYSSLGSSFACAASTNLSVSTAALTTKGTWHFEFHVTDSSSTPATVTSSPVTLNVEKALARPRISANATTIDSGNSSTLYSTNITSGTAPYTCQWLEKAPGASSYTNLSGSFACMTSSNLSISTGALYIKGTWHFEFQVIDGGNPAEVVTSNAVAVKVEIAE